MKDQPKYMPDLTAISLDAFKKGLQTGRLLPGRRPLLDDIDLQFSRLETAGVVNVGMLRKRLKNTAGLNKLAKETGLAEDYLKLLRREVSSLLPTPVKFSELPLIADGMLDKLTDLDIADTEKLYPYVHSPEKRKDFRLLSGFSEGEVLWLTKLVDVSRIRWVGPKLARLILDTPFDTVEKLSIADPAEVLSAFHEAKTTYKAYDGPLGIEDVGSWIRQVVVKTPRVIVY